MRIPREWRPAALENDYDLNLSLAAAAVSPSLYLSERELLREREAKEGGSRRVRKKERADAPRRRETCPEEEPPPPQPRWYVGN